MAEFAIAPENVAISVSYLCLFIVLVWYKYEILFRTALLFIVIFGPWFPFLYGIPYLLVLWRFYVGLNVSTDQTLYIGRTFQNMEDSDASNTTNHWAVVVQNQSRFLYTHAVGQVVSGRGIRKHFKEIDEAKLRRNYSLVPVGFVTRKDRERKMEVIVEQEPMQSGNTCQEFATDIAFQLSSSRTYTFLKIMMLLRIRNVIFYTTAAISILLYLFNFFIAKVFNIAVIINTFTAIEMARIGIHNQPQKGVIPVIQAFYNYPTNRNFLQLSAITVLYVIMYWRFGLLETMFMSFINMCVVIMALGSATK